MEVAIVSYNTREHLSACLTTVLRENASRVVVIDNASRDGSAEMVRSRYPAVLLEVNETNPGYGAALNQAISRCSGDYVLLLNSDTLLHPGTLGTLREHLDRHPRAAVVGPRLVNRDGTLQPSCYPFPTPLNTLLVHTTLGRLVRRVPVLRQRILRTWSPHRPRIVPWVLGAALAIRRKAFEGVGGFDPRFFMFFEETDLCYRLVAAGWEVHFTPMATVTHTGGVSTDQHRGDMALQLAASNVDFFRKHRPRHVGRIRLVLHSVALARWIIDGVRLLLTRDRTDRSRIEENRAVWKRVLVDLRHR